MLPRQFYSLLQKINEHTPHGTPVSEVYMLHEVYADGETPRDSGCAVSLGRFIAWLDSLDTARVTVPEHLSKQGSILLTFDDIFASAYRWALPQLRERGLPYTVFIATGFLGRQDHISQQDLCALANDPLCTIGAHTVHHSALRLQKGIAVHQELMDSKSYLEDTISREVSDFAFPYGSVYACSRSNIAQVSVCGFRRGFSTLNRSVTAADLHAPWFLPRRNISDSVLQRKGF